MATALDIPTFTLPPASLEMTEDFSTNYHGRAPYTHSQTIYEPLAYQNSEIDLFEWTIDSIGEQEQEPEFMNDIQYSYPWTAWTEFASPIISDAGQPSDDLWPANNGTERRAPDMIEAPLARNTCTLQESLGTDKAQAKQPGEPSLLGEDWPTRIGCGFSFPDESPVPVAQHDVESPDMSSVCPPAERETLAVTQPRSPIEPASQPHRVARKAPGARKSKTTETQWQRARPFIEELYIRMNMDLKQVQRITAHLCGLYATIPMYKKRLAQWKLKKYYTRGVKEELMQQLDESGDARQWLARSEQHGQPLRLGCLARYLRSSQTQHGAQRGARIARLQLAASPESQRFEAILRLMRNYGMSCLERLLPKSGHRYPQELLKVFSYVLSAELSADRPGSGDDDDARRRAALCAATRRLVAAHPLLLAWSAPWVFSARQWRACLPDRDVELRRMLAIACAHHGRDHPVVELLRQIVGEGVSAELTREAVAVQKDVLFRFVVREGGGYLPPIKICEMEVNLFMRYFTTKCFRHRGLE